MTAPRVPDPIAERWAQDEEAMAENPRTLDAQPRWITDDLGDQYGPGVEPTPTMDDFALEDL